MIPPRIIDMKTRVLVGWWHVHAFSVLCSECGINARLPGMSMCALCSVVQHVVHNTHNTYHSSGGDDECDRVPPA